MKTKIIVLLTLTTHLIAAQNTLKELKRYAFYICVAQNYHQVDSLCHTHDHTASHIFEVKKISNELMDEVRLFTYEKTKEYHKDPPPAFLIDTKANYVCYLCADFYESRQLHHFIKNLIRKYRKKQPLSDDSDA
ncbi:hypothetical protein [Capnocytophaga haemolytica]